MSYVDSSALGALRAVLRTVGGLGHQTPRRNYRTVKELRLIKKAKHLPDVRKVIVMVSVRMTRFPTTIRLA